MKLWPARSELAMMVSTSGSCSRSFSARFFIAMRSAIHGPAPRRRPRSATASSGLRRMAAPEDARRRGPRRPRARRTRPSGCSTPAASSSASTRPLKPRESAKRRPNRTTRFGDPPGALAVVRRLDFAGSGRVTEAIRAAISRSLLRPDRGAEQQPAQRRTRRRPTRPTTIIWATRDLPEAGGERAVISGSPFGSSAKVSASRNTPRSASLSRNFGRRPVDFRRPWNWPSSSMPGGVVERRRGPAA